MGKGRPSPRLAELGVWYFEGPGRSSPREGRDGEDRRPPRRGWRCPTRGGVVNARVRRSEEHTSELQSLMRISYAVFCLKKKKYRKQRYASNLTFNNNQSY